MFDRYLDQFKLALGLALLCAVLGCVWYFHEWAYEQGAADKKAEWDADKADRVQKALEASEANRAKEKSLNDKVRKALDENQKLQAANAIATAELDRVQHNFQAALNSRCAENPTATGCTDAAGRVERELLGECAVVAIKLAAAAQRLTAKTLGLQDYIKSTQ